MLLSNGQARGLRHARTDTVRTKHLSFKLFFEPCLSLLDFFARRLDMAGEYVREKKAAIFADQARTGTSKDPPPLFTTAMTAYARKKLLHDRGNHISARVFPTVLLSNPFLSCNLNRLPEISIHADNV